MNCEFLLQLEKLGNSSGPPALNVVNTMKLIGLKMRNKVMRLLNQEKEELIEMVKIVVRIFINK